jgi:pilus assembly protein FimV
LISQAATLGEARVQSSLTEPLEVEVPLARSSSEPLDEIKVQLAPPAFYEQAGIPPGNVPSDLIFNIESRAGRDYVVIRSRRAMRDPILSILLEVSTPEGRMIREYNLLLDPPGTGAAAVETEAAPARTDSPVTVSSRPTWERVEPADVELDHSYTVQRGDALSRIAARYATPGEDIRPLMQAIIDANPDAFVDGNGNVLLAEAELKVPAPRSDAPREEAQTEGPVDQGPALELLEPKAAEENPSAGETDSRPHEEMSGATRNMPLPSIDSVADDQTATALDLEELESLRAENENLTEELQSLNDEIASIKLSIDEREARITELQRQVDQARAENAELQEEARAQNAELREMQSNFWIRWGKYLVGGLGAVLLALLIALGLRRSSGKKPEPMPAPPPASTPAPDPGTAAGGATMAMAAADEALGEEGGEQAGAAGSEQDPLDPRAALDEARMLESFNLVRQAVDLLEDSLAEHPDHEGLREELTRLRNDEQGGAQEPAGSPDGEDREESGEPYGSQELNEPEALNEPSTDEVPEAPETLAEPALPEEEVTAASGTGTIAWDEDFDHVLATPESESGSAQGESDGDLMEFEDSYALETPAEDRQADQKRETAAPEEIDFSLPELDESADQASSEAREPAPTWSEKEERGETPESEDLAEIDLGDLSGEETVETESEVTRPEEPASPEPVREETEQAEDTRVSLAEAFLDVGDRESFEMIESELLEEGATKAFERLEELKKRYE